MQLGKAKKANDFLDSLRAEGEVVEARPCPATWFNQKISSKFVIQQTSDFMRPQAALGCPGSQRTPVQHPAWNDDGDGGERLAKSGFLTYSRGWRRPAAQADPAPAAPGAAGAATAGIAQQMAGEPVSVVVEEKLLVSLNKDGGVESMEVQGIMSLQARPPAKEITLTLVKEKLLVSLNKDGRWRAWRCRAPCRRRRARRPGDHLSPKPIPRLLWCQTELGPPVQVPARATCWVWFDAVAVAGCLHVPPSALRALAVQQGAALCGPMGVPRRALLRSHPCRAGRLGRAGARRRRGAIP